MATYEKYLREEDAYDFSDDEGRAFHAANPHASKGFPKAEDMSDTGFTPQQLKNLRIYVLGMEGSKRHLTLKRGIMKLRAGKTLNSDESGSVADFCNDVLDGDTTKFKALMK
jgi:hypothetical protein